MGCYCIQRQPLVRGLNPFLEVEILFVTPRPHRMVEAFCGVLNGFFSTSLKKFLNCQPIIDVNQILVETHSLRSMDSVLVPHWIRTFTHGSLINTSCIGTRGTVHVEAGHRWSIRDRYWPLWLFSFPAATYFHIWLWSNIFGVSLWSWQSATHGLTSPQGDPFLTSLLQGCGWLFPVTC